MNPRRTTFASLSLIILTVITAAAQSAASNIARGSISEVRLRSVVFLQISDDKVRQAIADQILKDSFGQMIPLSSSSSYEGADFAISFIQCLSRAPSSTEQGQGRCLARGWPSSNPAGQMVVFQRTPYGKPIRILWEDPKGENRSLEAIQDFVKAVRENDPAAARLAELNANDVPFLLTESLRPKVLSRRPAKYNEEARAHYVRGKVILSVVFRADGKVDDIRILKDLPYGLTESAIAAARQIRFEPATRDGKPVSVRSELTFDFALY